MPARIAKHPIHTMLVGFPIALWTFSLVGDVIFLYGGNSFWRDLALSSMLGGLIGAIAAAIPGVLDYLSMSASPAKRIATRHMVLNLIVVGLYDRWLAARFVSARAAARRHGLIEAVVDPFVPPMPAKITIEQATHFAGALARGEPNRSKIAWTVLSDKIRELV